MMLRAQKNIECWLELLKGIKGFHPPKNLLLHWQKFAGKKKDQSSTDFCMSTLQNVFCRIKVIIRVLRECSFLGETILLRRCWETTNLPKDPTKSTKAQSCFQFTLMSPIAQCEKQVLSIGII